MVSFLYGGGIGGVIMLICAIWVIYDTWAVRKASKENKIIWTVLGVIFSVLAAIVYWIMYKR